MAGMYVHCMAALVQGNTLREVCYKYLWVFSGLEGLAAHAPDLIEHTAVAPHITGSRVDPELDGLWSSPADWDLASVGEVVVLIC